MVASSVTEESGGMLRSNFKLLNLSPTLEVWDKALGFTTTTAELLAFVVWFSQGSYQFIW